LGSVLTVFARSDLGHVALRVAAVDTQGVELHQLARVVLVEPRGPALVRARRHDETRPRAHPVVQVEEHRRVARGGEQEVAEPAERVRADHVALE